MNYANLQKVILYASSFTLLISWAFTKYHPAKSWGRVGFYLTFFLQMAYLGIAVLIYGFLSHDLFVLVIVYAFAFNLILVVKKATVTWYPIAINFFLIALAVINLPVGIFEPFEITNYPFQNNVIVSLMSQLELILFSIVFSVISYLLYLLITSDDAYTSAFKVVRKVIIPVWISKIIIYSFWSEYLWGRFWSWDTTETKTLLILMLLVINFHLPELSFKNKNLIVGIVLVLTLLAFALPFTTYHGGYA